MTTGVSGQARLLRVREVAEALNVSTMTVYRLVKAGELRATRVGSSWRVFEDGVDEYLSRRAREAQAPRARKAGGAAEAHEEGPPGPPARDRVGGGRAQVRGGRLRGPR